jgi:hypothetical protein
MIDGWKPIGDFVLGSSNPPLPSYNPQLNVIERF